MSELHEKVEQGVEHLEKEVQQKNTEIHQYIGMQNKSNALGVAGFVLALIGLFISWIPVFGTLIWILGTVFSVIGLFKEPRGLAIAGTVLSFIGLIFLTVLGGLLSMMF